MKFRVYNSTLEPQIWDDNNVLKPEVKVRLLKVAQDFYQSTDLKSPIMDILFLGSVTNYNWTSTSDIDLHLVVDISKENVAPEHTRQFMDGLGASWNNNHEIEIHGHPVEVYLQSPTETNSTPENSRRGSTIYSVLRGCWLKPPDLYREPIDKEKIKQKYHKIKKMVDEFVSEKNVEKLKKLMKTLKNYRNSGLENVGEFSTENLVFKALRHTEVITKLKDAINTLYDKSVSLNEIVDRNSNLFLGFIRREDFKVVGTSVDDEDFTHFDFLHELGREWMMIFDTNLIPWRYKKSTNTVYYWYGRSHPNEDEKESLEFWLEKNLNVRNPSHKFISSSPYNPKEMSTDKMISHTIDEAKIKIGQKI